MLADRGLLAAGAPVLLNVYHDQLELASPTMTEVQVVNVCIQRAFWLDRGSPLFGPDAIGGQGGVVRPAGNGGSVVARLAGLDPSWCRSVFVRIGNPHCVTVLPDAAMLPAMDALRAAGLHAHLAGGSWQGCSNVAKDPGHRRAPAPPLSPARSGTWASCPQGGSRWRCPVALRRWTSWSGVGSSAGSGCWAL